MRNIFSQPGKKTKKTKLNKNKTKYNKYMMCSRILIKDIDHVSTTTILETVIDAILMGFDVRVNHPYCLGLLCL